MSVNGGGGGSSGAGVVGGGGGGGVGGDVAKPVTVQVQALWLLAWLVNNIGITMLNKYAFSIAGFNYPLVTSAFHMLCNWLGTVVYFRASGAQRQAIQKHQWPTLVVFSVVFSLNIAVGNTSSAMVPVTFNQVRVATSVPDGDGPRSSPFSRFPGRRLSGVVAETSSAASKRGWGFSL